jgi:hypothetical protein
MVSGIFHQGSGIGNQLHRYVATRVLAADKGYAFGMVAPENCKVLSFMNLDMGEPVVGSWSLGEGGKVIPITSMASWEEKKTTENGIDIRGYDPEFNFVADNTIIDGEFQDERYFEHRLDEVREWLKVDKLPVPDHWCVLGFRGGEFKAFPDLLLPRSYWEEAMDMMRKERPDMKFVVVSDDPDFARTYLPPVDAVYHDAEMDWRMVSHAKYLILSNSSFYIFPALLNPRHGKIIAPRYWARRNTGVWATNQNYYKKFIYI